MHLSGSLSCIPAALWLEAERPKKEWLMDGGQMSRHRRLNFN